MKVREWFKDCFDKNMIYLIPTLLWIVVLTLLNVFCASHVLNSDISAELVLAKEMARRNRLFLTDWYYSTEIRVFYTQIVAAFFFKFIHSWNLVRSLTNFVFYILILGSYLFAVKPMGVTKRAAYLSSVFLFIPYSMEYIYIVHIGNSYMPHFVVLFLCLGCMLRVLQDKNRWSWCAYVIISVYAGICGLRFLTAYALPIVLAAIIHVLLANADLKETLFSTATWKSRKIYVPFVGFVSFLAGFMFLEKVLMHFVSVGKRNELLFNVLNEGGLLARLDDQFSGALRLFGYYDFSSMSSLRGMASLAAVVIVVALMIITVMETRRYRKLSLNKQFMLLVFWMSLGINLVLFVLVAGTYAPRYYMPTLVLLAPILAMYLDDSNLLRFDFHKLLLAGLAVSMCISGIEQVVLWSNLDLNAPYKEVTKFLVENNLTYGLTTYWQSEVLNELSDGRIETYTIGDDITTSNNWLTSKKHAHSSTWNELASDRLFMLLSDEELECNRDQEILQSGSVVYNENGYTIYIFDRATFMQNYGHYYLVD